MAFSVVHDVPGRLRLRLPPGTTGAGLDETLLEQSGVVGCRWSPRTRGLLVLYRPDLTTARSILEIIATRSGHSVGAPAAGTPAASRSQPPVARAVVQVMSELNSSVDHLTGGVLDLRTLAPLALVAWALLEIVRGKAGPLAWSAALWYAHGLFRDYTLPTRPA